jgi:hypothetical protein
LLQDRALSGVTASIFSTRVEIAGIQTEGEELPGDLVGA